MPISVWLRHGLKQQVGESLGNELIVLLDRISDHLEQAEAPAVVDVDAAPSDGGLALTAPAAVPVPDQTARPPVSPPATAQDTPEQAPAAPAPATASAPAPAPVPHPVVRRRPIPVSPVVQH